MYLTLFDGLCLDEAVGVAAPEELGVAVLELDLEEFGVTDEDDVESAKKNIYAKNSTN